MMILRVRLESGATEPAIPRYGSIARAHGILFLVVLGCADARPVRLVAGRSDTVIVNSRGSVSLAVRVVDVKGIEHAARGVRYRLTPGGTFKLGADGRVTCDRPGDGQVEATYEDLSTRVTVLCRPVEGFRLPRVLRLTIGGPPMPLDVGAYGVDGTPIDMIAGTASVRDSQVASLIDGKVHARARGITSVDVEVGDCTTSIPVEVVESSNASGELRPHQQYAESLNLSAGELRSWRLTPGSYEIKLLGDSGAPVNLRLASHQMNCAALPQTEQQYSCIAGDHRASVVVHHTEAAGRGRLATATLLLHRRADLGSDAAWRPRHVIGCPFIPR